MSYAVAIADAVAATINAAPSGTFSEEFEAQRRIRPVFEPADLADLKVTVVPRSIAIEAGDRSTDFFDAAVDIAVQRKVDQQEESQVVALLDLAEEIGDHLRHRRLDGLPDVVFRSLAHEPLVAVEHLDQMGVFTSVLTLTYRARR